MKTASGMLDPMQDLVDHLRQWENFRIIDEWRREQARIQWIKRDRWQAEGRCVVCGAKVEFYDQYSRCYYAEPCGHRQGQGKAAGGRKS